MRKIVIDPDICNGAPTIEGTRIAAQTVIEFGREKRDITDKKSVMSLFCSLIKNQ